MSHARFAKYAKQIGRTSPALGRPTPIQPFPNPDMDGINRHSTTTQPSIFVILQIRLNHNHNHNHNEAEGATKVPRPPLFA